MRTRYQALILGLVTGFPAVVPATYPVSQPAGPVAYPSLRQFGGDFTLTDQYGKPFSLHDARGKVVLIYFGFTSCADTCPVTLTKVAAALRELGDLAGRVQPLFISVDPERDTQAVLRRYMRYFHSSILGLTGRPEEIEAVARQYRAPVYHPEIGRNDGFLCGGSQLQALCREYRGRAGEYPVLRGITRKDRAGNQGMLSPEGGEPARVMRNPL